MDKCDPLKVSQWFEMHSCSNYPKFTKGKCGAKSRYDEKSFCSLQTVKFERGPINCIDILGENPNPGGTLIGYLYMSTLSVTSNLFAVYFIFILSSFDCSGGWNQQWR